MKPKIYNVEIYVSESGKSPVKKWLKKIDYSVIGRINNRIKRLKFGNFGDFKNLGYGLFELRLNFDSGYRIYYTFSGKKIILLLNCGDKSTQKKDIEIARQFIKEVSDDK